MKKVLDAVLSGLLFMHFAVLGIYLMPINPVKVAYGSLIKSYVTPLFSQSWNLFAPKPSTYNTYVFVRYSVYGSNPNLKDADWLEVTTPLIEKSKGLFFLGSRKRLKFLSNSVRDILVQMRRTNEYEQHNDTIFLSKAFRAMGNENLLKYSTWALKGKNIFDVLKVDSVQVQYKIVRIKVPNYYTMIKKKEIKNRVTTIMSSFANIRRGSTHKISILSQAK